MFTNFWKALLTLLTALFVVWLHGLFPTTLQVTYDSALFGTVVLVLITWFLMLFFWDVLLYLYQRATAKG